MPQNNSGVLFQERRVSLNRSRQSYLSGDQSEPLSEPALMNSQCLKVSFRDTKSRSSIFWRHQVEWTQDNITPDSCRPSIWTLHLPHRRPSCVGRADKPALIGSYRSQDAAHWVPVAAYCAFGKLWRKRVKPLTYPDSARHALADVLATQITFANCWATSQLAEQLRGSIQLRRLASNFATLMSVSAQLPLTVKYRLWRPFCRPCEYEE